MKFLKKSTLNQIKKLQTIFLSLLPTEYSFSDINNTEKIVYPKRRLLVRDEDKGWNLKKATSVIIFHMEASQYFMKIANKVVI